MNGKTLLLVSINVSVGECKYKCKCMSNSVCKYKCMCKRKWGRGREGAKAIIKILISSNYLN